MYNIHDININLYCCPLCTSSRAPSSPIFTHASVKSRIVAQKIFSGNHFSGRKVTINQCYLDKSLRYHTELMQN